MTGNGQIAVGGDKCPICGRSHLKRFEAHAYDIKGRTVAVTECRHCEVAWQWPMGRDESTAIIRRCHEVGEGFWDPAEAVARTRLQAEFIGGLGPPGKLLDIGGADGQFAVAAASLGWECTVIDPAFPSRRISDRVSVINGLVSGLPAEPTYDMATMWAMIEHVPDYVSLMHHAFQRLKRGGQLVIEALNYQSLARIREGENWWGFQVDHRWYLSPAVYRKHAFAVGFSEFEIHRTVLRSHWRGEASQVRPGRSYLKEAVRTPWRVAAVVAAFVTDRRAMRRWPEWYALPIQTIVATK